MVVVCCGGVGVVVVASVCPSTGQTHRTSIPTVVVSLTTHDNMYENIYVHVHVHVYRGSLCHVVIGHNKKGRVAFFTSAQFF